MNILLSLFITSIFQFFNFNILPLETLVEFLENDEESGDDEEQGDGADTHAADDTHGEGTVTVGTGGRKRSLQAS